MLSKSEEKLSKAVNLYLEEYFAQLPSDDELNQKFLPSKKQTQRMERMFKHNGNLFYVLTSTTKRAVIALLVSILILTNIVVLATPTLRDHVVEFFFEIHKDFTRVTFDVNEDTPSVIEDIYMPQWIPDGFSIDKELYDNSLIRIAYTNESNQRIVYSQYTMRGTVAYFDTDEDPLHEISLNGFKAYQNYSNGEYQLVWNNEFYNFNIIGPDPDTIMKVAKSVIISEKSPPN